MTWRIVTTAALAAAVTTAACSDTPRGVATPDRTARTGGSSAYDRAADEGRDDVRIVRASGDIAFDVGQFRNLLGALNPNIAGVQSGGRREINWDAVPAIRTNVDTFPANFFNVNSPRGVVFTTPGTGFRISDVGFVDVNPSYTGEFSTFSPTKLFAAVASTVTEIDFFVAGSTTPASVNGFGSVFADVGREQSTIIEYFDASGTRLLKLAVPRATDARGLSFAGAVFGSRIVAKVRITSGDTPIGIDAEDNVKGAGKKRDIVVMDDFIYGEPRPRF